jgi:hypothetical protein
MMPTLVLAQTSTDQTDYRFLLAIYDGVIATKQSRRGPGADTDADRGRQSLTPARTVWTLTGNADKSRSTYTVFARCYLNESA